MKLVSIKMLIFCFPDFHNSIIKINMPEQCMAFPPPNECSLNLLYKVLSLACSLSSSFPVHTSDPAKKSGSLKVIFLVGVNFLSIQDL